MRSQYDSDYAGFCGATKTTGLPFVSGVVRLVKLSSLILMQLSQLMDTCGWNNLRLDIGSGGKLQYSRVHRSHAWFSGTCRAREGWY